MLATDRTDNSINCLTGQIILSTIITKLIFHNIPYLQEVSCYTHHCTTPQRQPDFACGQQWQHVNSFAAGERNNQGSHIRESRHKCDFIKTISYLENMMHGLCLCFSTQLHYLTLETVTVHFAAKVISGYGAGCTKQLGWIFLGGMQFIHKTCIAIF